MGLADWIEERLLPLRGLSELEIATRVKSYWRELDDQGRFLLTKLVGGGFRVGVSKLLVQRALAAHSGIDAKRVAQRMMGYTDGKGTALGRALPGADREGRGGRGHRCSTKASPIPSSWRISSTHRRKCSPPSSGR